MSKDVSSAFELLRAYKALGLESDATPERVRQTYRDLIRVWHPDRFQNDERNRLRAEEELKRINAAYEVLMRRFESAKVESPPQPPPRTPNPHPPAQPPAAPVPYPPPPAARARPERTAPVATVAAIAIGAIILAVAIGLAATQQQPTQPTGTPAATQTAAAPAQPQPAPQPAPKPTARTPSMGDFWTAVVASYKKSGVSNAAAQKRANAVAAKNLDAMLIDSDKFDSLRGGYWVVAVGETLGKFDATQQLALAKKAGYKNAYLRHVRAVIPLTEKIPRGYFTLGSTEAAVRTAQGSPSGIIGDTWNYGYSSVYFSGGVVDGWSTIDVKLHATFPTKRRAGATFTKGSSQEDVLAAQGTPTSIIGDTWSYGYSSVYFDGGVVDGWSEIDVNLRIR